MKRLITTSLLMMTLCAPGAWAQDWLEALRDTHGVTGGDVLLGSDPAKAMDGFGFGFTHGEPNAKFDVQVVPVQGADVPFDRALRVTVKDTPRLEWFLTLGNKAFTKDFKKGQKLLVTFWARSPEAETDGGLMAMKIGAGFPSWRDTNITPGAEWRQYVMPVTVRKNARGNQVELGFKVGQQRQVLEIGGIGVLDFGQSDVDLPSAGDPQTYPGAEDPQDAPWREAARQRIEEHRKGDLNVRVVDAQGNPVPGAEVRVELTRPAFHWGNGADLGYFGGGLWDQMEKRYLNLGADGFGAEGGSGRTFTSAGFGVHNKWDKWSEAIEKSDGDVDKTHVGRAINWLHDNGIDHVRGHVLMWGDLQSVPKDVRQEFFKRGGKGSDKAMQYLIGETREHIRDTVAQLDGYVDEWDLVNEFLHRMMFEESLGYDAMVQEVARWFEIAEQANSDGIWYVNDNRMLSHAGRQTFAVDWVYQFTKDLKDAGATIHGVGMQGHLGYPLADPRRVYEILDKLASLDVELKVTELDISKGVSEMEAVRAGVGENEASVDDDLAAQYLRDFLLMVYSHPSVTGIQMWGMWDQTHWKKNALLYAPNWKLKPTGKVYVDMVFNEWWTDETLQSSDDGTAAVRGTLGDYRVTATRGGQTGESTATLGRDGETVTVQLR